MGFFIHDAEVIALANEVKRMLGAKTKEQAIGMALANLLKEPNKELSSERSPNQDEVQPKQRRADVD